MEATQPSWITPRLEGWRADGAGGDAAVIEVACCVRRSHGFWWAVGKKQHVCTEAVTITTLALYSGSWQGVSAIWKSYSGSILFEYVFSLPLLNHAMIATQPMATLWQFCTDLDSIPGSSSVCVLISKCFVTNIIEEFNELPLVTQAHCNSTLLDRSCYFFVLLWSLGELGVVSREAASHLQTFLERVTLPWLVRAKEELSSPGVVQNWNSSGGGD